jgi:hypothetical protein
VVLEPGVDSHPRVFDRSCLTCSITVTYRLQSNASLTAALTDGALTLLPPLPNLPSVNLPQLPPLTLPAPPAGGVPPQAGSVVEPPTVALPAAPPAAASLRYRPRSWPSPRRAPRWSAPTRPHARRSSAALSAAALWTTPGPARTHW